MRKHFYEVNPTQCNQTQFQVIFLLKYIYIYIGKRREGERGSQPLEKGKLLISIASFIDSFTQKIGIWVSVQLFH